jgi:hypothetical protein
LYQPFLGWGWVYYSLYLVCHIRLVLWFDRWINAFGRSKLLAGAALWESMGGGARLPLLALLAVRAG